MTSPLDSSKEAIYSSLVYEITTSKTLDPDKIEGAVRAIFDKHPDLSQQAPIITALKSHVKDNSNARRIVFRVKKIMQEAFISLIRKGLSKEDLAQFFTQLQAVEDISLLEPLLSECMTHYPLQTLQQLPSFEQRLDSLRFAQIQNEGFHEIQPLLDSHPDQLFEQLKDVQDHELLFSLAIVCAKKNIVTTLDHFAEFHITSALALKEFLRFFFGIMIQNDVRTSTSIAKIFALPQVKMTFLKFAKLSVRYLGYSLLDIRDAWKNLLPPPEFKQLCQIAALHSGRMDDTALDIAIGRRRNEEENRITIITATDEVDPVEKEWFEILLFQACCQVARGDAHLIEADYGDLADPFKRAIVANYHATLAKYPEIFETSNSLAKRRENALALLGSLWGAEALQSDSSLSKALEQICKYRNGHIALELMEVLTQELAPSQAGRDSYKAGVKGAAYLALVMLPIAAWRESEESDATLKDFKILLQPFRKLLKDTASGLERAWLLTTLALNKTTLSSERKLQMMKQVLDTKDVKELQLRLSSIHLLCKNNKMELLDRKFSKNMTEEFLDILKSILGEFLTTDNVTRFMDTLGNMRVPYAWKQYEHRLKETGSEQALSCYHQFLRDVLEGTSEKTRYERITSHIEKIREKHEAIWEKWQKKMAAQSIEVDLTNRTTFSFRDFLLLKIRDGHVDGRFKKLILHVNKDSSDVESREAVDQKELVSQIEERLLALYDRPLVGEELLRELGEIVIACDLLKVGIELRNDLRGLIGQLAQRKGVKTYTVVNTDDWQDLLLCGTEVQGSCQNVESSSDFNKGLLGYLIDGKNQLIAIKNEGGAIIARCIVRLLWDERAGCPALFQERVYSNIHSADVEKALDAYALKLAHHLGCKLYRANVSSGEHLIVSLSSSSPFEYVDAVRGVTDGKYKIAYLN